ncbi:MAG TPA: hypothetical protein PKX74_06080 [Leptospiraceae bacterium]|nr:hypothetical protein [Leptospiraceae bacterium]HMZ37439.1 hypothetical protein [Leptospiraceae bacterium]HNE24802.1 hypothetical protein [Leptospiraceae bacterium]HNJ34996.1 hypothetical protein [Leptospiraceae bacterium]HNK99717.1 hypothetical protein [Leptospiraceae bacterium]
MDSVLSYSTIMQITDTEGLALWLLLSVPIACMSLYLAVQLILN